jgi:uncharacterized membrane protein YkgB
VDSSVHLLYQLVMSGPLRENGPVLLVPLAWAFTAGAHVELIDSRAVLIGHLVMDVLLAAFAGLSWTEMRADSVLRAWLGVIVAGFVCTLVGTYMLATDGPVILAQFTVASWMLLPGVALVYTGQQMPADRWPRTYTIGGAASLLGAVLFVAAALTDAGLVVPSLALAGLGQTAGIVVAAL